MKKRIIALAAVAGAAGAYLSAISPRVKDRPNVDAFKGKVYAHRGMFGGKEMENSLEAFSKAVENGYGIELDVQISADGLPIVFHDANLLRMFGENISVSSLTAEELSEYGIPTLAEALEKLSVGSSQTIDSYKKTGAEIVVVGVSGQVELVVRRK